jgi:hypothetical protein
MDAQSSIYFNEVEYVVRKRTQHLSYLKKVVSVTPASDAAAPVFWMNVARVTPSVVTSFANSQAVRKRLEAWWYLGLSLGLAQQQPSGAPFVRACLQLCEEFDFHFGNIISQNLKQLRAVPADIVVAETPSPRDMDPSSAATLKPRLAKANGVVYAALHATRAPTTLCPVQTILSLCDILLFTYRRFLDESSALEPVHRAIVARLDRFYKHTFFGLVSRELTSVLIGVMKNEVKAVLAASETAVGEEVELAGASSGSDDD